MFPLWLDVLFLLIDAILSFVPSPARSHTIPDPLFSNDPNLPVLPLVPLGPDYASVKVHHRRLRSVLTDEPAYDACVLRCRPFDLCARRIGGWKDEMGGTVVEGIEDGARGGCDGGGKLVASGTLGQRQSRMSLLKAGRKVCAAIVPRSKFVRHTQRSLKGRSRWDSMD